MKSKRYSAVQPGQALLIIVMMLATVVTVVMTIAFSSTTETQITKLEEDSQRALAAAEAGLEAALAQPVGSPVSIGTLGDYGSMGISGTAQSVSVAEREFVSPILKKDEAYTFYFADYPAMTTPWGGPGRSVNIHFGTEGGCPFIEVAQLKSDNSVTRNVYKSACSTVNNGTPATATPATIDGITYAYRVNTFAIAADVRFLVVRVMGEASRVGLSSSVDLPSQGKVAESTARTQTGVAKRVQLFQSFPQIPAGFIQTAF